MATAIEWTDATWNPVTGCTRVSEGCRHCYAERLAATRLAQSPKYKGLAVMTPAGPRWSGQVRLHPELVAQPLRWIEPLKIFPCDMSDLFHEDVPDEFIGATWGVMALCGQHTFQVLTKRIDRAAELIPRLTVNFVLDCLTHHQPAIRMPARPQRRRVAELMRAMGRDPNAEPKNTAPNIWVGFSAENQQRLDWGIGHLLCIPAAIRWLSLEPLLGPIELPRRDDDGEDVEDDEERRAWGLPHKTISTHYAPPASQIDWVIVGGESGPGARPCDVLWIQSMVQQCKAAGVPCFVKQLGARPMLGDSSDPQGWPTNAGPVNWETGEIRLRDRKGADMAEWPADLRVREFPEQGTGNRGQGSGERDGDTPLFPEP